MSRRQRLQSVQPPFCCFKHTKNCLALICQHTGIVHRLVDYGVPEDQILGIRNGGCRALNQWKKQPLHLLIIHTGTHKRTRRVSWLLSAETEAKGECVFFLFRSPPLLFSELLESFSSLCLFPAVLVFPSVVGASQCPLSTLHTQSINQSITGDEPARG